MIQLSAFLKIDRKLAGTLLAHYFSMIYELHQKLIQVSQVYLKSEAELLSLFQQMDKLKGFRRFGYTSLFAYAVNELKLSESTSFNLINVARKCVQVPALRSEIEKGNLSIAKARKIVPVLNVENQSEWLEKAKYLSTRNLEKEVAKFAPKEMQSERTQYIGKDKVSLAITLDESTLNKLKRVQDIESNKKGRNVSFEEALETMSALYLEKFDPIEKAKRIALKKESPGTGSKKTAVTRQARKPIGAMIKHEVNLRDRAQCTEVIRGKRCKNKRWIHLHHIRPVSLGGEDAVENLTTLCSAHHQMVHEVKCDEDNADFAYNLSIP